jgi:hypothetical protein
VNGSRNAIIAHADALAAAEAVACTTQAVIELADMPQLVPAALQGWAQDVTGCVTRIDALHRAVVDKAVADRLGFALNIVGPIALVARERAGLSTPELVRVLVASNEALQSKLNPNCGVATFSQLAQRSVRITTCIQYTGTISRTLCLSGAPHCTDPVFLHTAKLESAALVSWSAADAALVALATT